MAARANEAYRQLRDPMLRARYLCEQAGVDLQTESNTSMDPAFLMQQMSWREALDDARGDAAALASLQAELQEARGQMRARLAQLLDVDKDYAAAGRKCGNGCSWRSWRRSWPTRNRRNSPGRRTAATELAAGLRPLSRKTQSWLYCRFPSLANRPRRTSASWRWASTLAPPIRWSPPCSSVAEVLRDEQGHALLPSAVRYFPGGRVTTGREPLAEQALDPLNTVVSVKRYMGRTLEEARASRAPYEFVDAPGMVRIRTVQGDLSPVEVSAQILAVLRQRAEDVLATTWSAP